MASIYRNRSGNWEGRVRRKGYPAQTRTFDTKAQAETWATEIESEMLKGVFVSRAEAERMTFGEALERYTTEITPRKKGWSRKETYRACLLRKHPLALRTLASIRGADIAALIRELQSRGLGRQSIRLYLELISHLFTVCRTEWGMESLSNPVQLIKRPAPAPPRERRLETDEEQRLKDAANNPRLRAVIEFALATAAREGEIASLRWADVDLDRRTARFADTKLNEPRTIPLPPAALHVLRSLPRRIDGRVFGMTTNAIQLAFRKARQRAEIQNIHFHDLRHEATSRFFEAGLSIEKVAAITGHKTWAMLKRYTHPRAEDIARELAAKA